MKSCTLYFLQRKQKKQEKRKKMTKKCVNKEKKM